MLKIFICEDDLIQRMRLEDSIKKKIIIEEYDMSIEVSTNNPNEVLSYLNGHENIRGIYFLDINLKNEIDGIRLGSEIRKKDIFSHIVYITTHSELMSLTFTYKVEAMDYIIKDDTNNIRKKINDCLERINEYHTSEKIQEEDRIKLHINNQIRVFLTKDIMFFETTETSHRIKLHLNNKSIEFYGNLTDLEKISSSFIRVHKSFLVNKNNINRIDKKKREVLMINGETSLISIRKLKLLK